MTTASMSPTAAAFLAGVIDSAGALLVIAGAGKVHEALHRARADSAIRWALRIGPRQWRIAELAAGTVECATGLLVCARILPAEGGAAMAGLGVVFAGLLIHARRVGAPGGCGCIGWTRRHVTAKPVTLREITRAALIVIAGVLSIAIRWPGPPPFRQPWFYGGAAAGLLILVLLSADAAPDILRCGWRRRRTARGTLAALTRHPVFQAMAKSVGPFAPEFGHRSAGCTEEYWFAASQGRLRARQVTVFQVTHLRDGALAVHATLRDSTPATMRLHPRPDGVGPGRLT